MPYERVLFCFLFVCLFFVLFFEKKYGNEAVDYEDDLQENTLIPLVSYSQTWLHYFPRQKFALVIFVFVTQQWKIGKRKAEKDELVGAAFLQTITPPDTTLDINHV